MTQIREQRLQRLFTTTTIKWGFMSGSVSLGVMAGWHDHCHCSFPEGKSFRMSTDSISTIRRRHWV